jgi:hypothetical protein
MEELREGLRVGQLGRVKGGGKWGRVKVGNKGERLKVVK